MDFQLDGIDENDHSGASVAGAGDVNDDGFDDLIVGAPGADPNGEEYAGESYIIFRFATDEPLTPIFGGRCREVLRGSEASESFHPGGGRDRVITGGGADTVFFDDRPGRRDVLTITDFNLLADTLDLRGAVVAATHECGTRIVLRLAGDDHDAVVLLDVAAPPLEWL